MAYTPEDDLVAGLLDGGCEICDEVLADPDGVGDGEVLDIGFGDGEEADRRGEEGGGTHIGRFETGLRGDERLFWNATADSEMKFLVARGWRFLYLELTLNLSSSLPLGRPLALIRLIRTIRCDPLRLPRHALGRPGGYTRLMERRFWGLANWNTTNNTG